MSKAYRIEIPGADVTGQKKAALFAHGVGVLSDRTHLEQYRHFYNCDIDGKWTYQSGPTVEDYREYWAKGGAKITEITAEKAQELYDDITKRPESFAPSVKAEKKTDEPSDAPITAPAPADADAKPTATADDEPAAAPKGKGKPRSKK
jgi:hypothetical protein